MTDTISLYVGCSPNGEDAESMVVLEYTARKVTTGDLKIHWMQLTHDAKSPWFCGEGGWNSSRWPTPFSAFRWGIPWAAGYKGKAIYMDSDMIIQSDLRELWETPLDKGTIVGAKSADRFCVCLWDCEGFGKLVQQNKLPDTKTRRADPLYHEMMKRGFMSNAHLITSIDPMWNNFDGEGRPLEDAKIIHYTDMSSQVHLKYAIPRLQSEGKSHWFDGDVRDHTRADLQALFDRLYIEAIDAGYTLDKVARTDIGDYTKLSQKGYQAQHSYAR